MVFIVTIYTEPPTRECIRETEFGNCFKSKLVCYDTVTSKASLTIIGKQFGPRSLSSQFVFYMFHRISLFPSYRYNIINIGSIVSKKFLHFDSTLVPESNQHCSADFIRSFSILFSKIFLKFLSRIL